MTRAGAAVYAMWLEAVARGLVGSVFAGFLPAAVRLPLRCDGVSRHPLFAVALGRRRYLYPGRPPRREVRGQGGPVRAGRPSH